MWGRVEDPSHQLRAASGNGNHIHAAVNLVKCDLSVGQCKQRVIASDTDILAGVETGATLANNDVARDDGFAAVLLDSQHFGIAVSSVL